MKNELDLRFYPDWANSMVVTEQSEIGGDFEIVRDPIIGKKIVTGQEIFSFLEQSNLLEKSLNIYDLKSFEPREFFNKFIKNGFCSVTAWNSSFKSEHGIKYFPSAHLYKDSVQVVFAPFNSQFVVDMSPIFIKC